MSTLSLLDWDDESMKDEIELTCCCGSCSFIQNLKDLVFPPFHGGAPVSLGGPPRESWCAPRHLQASPCKVLPPFPPPRESWCAPRHLWGPMQGVGLPPRFSGCSKEKGNHCMQQRNGESLDASKKRGIMLGPHQDVSGKIMQQGGPL